MTDHSVQRPHDGKVGKNEELPRVFITVLRLLLLLKRLEIKRFLWYQLRPVTFKNRNTDGCYMS